MTQGHFEAVKYAYRQSKDGFVLSFVVHPNDMPDALATAAIGSRFMVGFAEIAEPGPKPALETGPVGGAAPPKPNSTRAVMMAKDPEFWDYLNWLKMPSEAAIRSAEDAELRIKDMLLVDSKSELNHPDGVRAMTGPPAAFDTLRENFYAWRREHRL